jgi:predicted MFS family arabinose efflux permease
LDVGAGTTQTVEPATLGKGAWWSLFLICLICMINSLDRAVMVVVIEPIKHEFHLKDSQLGLLTGLAFGASYAVFAIPLGGLADRMNRRNLLAILLAAWSLGTAACGLARDFVTLLVARMVVGAAESGSPPTTNSMISDLFPPHRRATAMALYFTAPAIGASLAFLVGGHVAQAYGWRAAFLMAGVPGLLLAAILVMVMRHPERGATEAAATPAEGSVLGGLRQLVSNPALVCSIFAYTLAAAVTTGVSSWFPSLLIREHGLSLQTAASTMALGTGLFSILGVGLGGRIADAVAKGRSGRLLLFTCVTLTLALACGVFAVTARSTPLAIAGLCGFGLFNMAQNGPMLAVLLNATPNRNRGVAVAGLQVSTNFLGTGLGPWTVGMLSDHYTGPRALSHAVLTVLPAELAAVTLCLIAWRILQRRAGHIGGD